MCQDATKTSPFSKLKLWQWIQSFYTAGGEDELFAFFTRLQIQGRLDQLQAAAAAPAPEKYEAHGTLLADTGEEYLAAGSEQHGLGLARAANGFASETVGSSLMAGDCRGIRGIQGIRG